MTKDEIFTKVVEIVRPFVKNPEALESVNENTNILQDLKVNSARLVDIILDFEDAFGIEVEVLWCYSAHSRATGISGCAPSDIKFEAHQFADSRKALL